MLTNICPESSKVLERFNICGRKGKEKERAKTEKKNKGGKGERITPKIRKFRYRVVLSPRFCTAK